MTATSSPTAHPRLARDAVRPQITDLPMENIAEMAVRAQQLGDVIPLWYGEGDMVTPAFIRDAAKAAFDAGHDVLHSEHARIRRRSPKRCRPISRNCTASTSPVERTTVTPGGMQSLEIAMELVLDLGQNAVYIEPQWPNIRSDDPSGRRRAAARRARLRRQRLDGSICDKVFKACDARTRAIVFSTPANPTGWVASEAELKALLAFSARARHLDHLRRGLCAALLRWPCGALDPDVRRARRPRADHQQLLQGVGDDRLARRLVDASGLRRGARSRP